MSGSRGRKVTVSRPGADPRWPERQQPYYNQNTSIPDLRSGWDNWNFRPTNGFNAWQHSSNLHQVWPSTQYRGGYFNEDRLPRTGDFDNFQHRFPNSFNAPNHFAERSLAHLNHTPLNELTSGSHSGSRDLATPRETSSSHNKQPISAKDKQNVQSVRSKVTDRSAAGRSRIPSSESQQDSSNQSPRVPVSTAEKQSVPAKSTSFMPPNDDLRNKVKASLEKFAAAKDQVPVKMNSSTSAEPLLPSSPQKVRESRVLTVETLPSPTTRHAIRLPAGCHRRTSQSSSTSNSAVNNDASSNPLEGIGFIQNTSSGNPICTDQTSRVANAATISGSDVPAQENEPLTTIPKDQLNKYIRSMDNHQRRQLVEQPRAIISQYMLNHLVQENQTARARQLSSLRFRVSSNELEFSSRTETNVILSEELVDEFKELLSRGDEESVTPASTSKRPDSEDEDIQVLEPPPKEPPLCIDLDLDDKSSPDASPSPLTRLPAKTPVSIQQDKKAPVFGRVESPSYRNNNNLAGADRTPASPLMASSRSTVASTEVVPVPEVPVQTSVVTETTTVSQAPCPVPVNASPVSRCNPPSTMIAPVHPQSTKNRPSSASTSIPPCITTTVSAGKKSFLEKPSKNKKRKEKREMKKKGGQEKPNSKKKKKNKKKSPTTSPVKTNAELMIHWREAQSTSENTAEAGESDKTEMVASALERAESLEKGPQSGRTKSALNFLLVDLQAEEQEGKNRIALIDRTIEELQLERKALTDKVLALKQKQFDLLRSAMCSNTFDDDSSSGPLESVKAAIKAPPVPEIAKDEHKVVEDKTTNDDTSTVQATPTVASIQLLSLMHQLEENGVQVNLGDVELAVPLDPAPPVSAITSLGNKRKRITGDDSKQPKKKGTPTNSPSRNATGAQAVEKPDQLPANSLLIHPIQSNHTPGPLQTLSVGQVNQISSTISAVIAQSVEPNSEKKAASPLAHGGQSKKATTSEISVAAESQTSSNESSMTKSHNVPSSAIKAMEPKKLTSIHEKTVADKSAPKTSQAVEKETYVTISRPAEAVRTYSRREDSTNQKTTPKPAPVNTQSAGTNAKTPRPAGSNQVIDLAATHPIPIEKATSCPVPAEIAPPPSLNASSSPDSCNFVLLRSHQSSVRCVFICGPCAFTASEDGTVHIYDLMTNSLSMRILGHTKPVTWLYAASLNTPSEVLKTIRYTTEYLNHLTLITGSEDAHIRQFSLDSGALLHEKFCDFPLTCVVAHKLQSKLYVGTTEGTIYTYTPKLNALRANKFKANAEVIFMKILVVRGKRAIIVAARRMDPVIYDLETEEALFTLTSNIPSSSFYSISTAANLVFCCDANKNVFKFDINSDKPLCQTDTLPSAAVGSFYDGKRFLVLGCMDGVIRVLDTTQKPPSRLFALPGHVLKTLTCMKVVGERIVGGSLNGEVAYCRLPNLEALSKSQPQM